MLIVNRAQCSYAGDQVFRYNFELRSEGSLLVNGPSGVGKSTLLDLLCGFLPLLSGSISFDGQDISVLEPGERPIAIVFQRENVFDHLSVYQNVRLGLARGRRERTEEHAQIDGCLDRVGLGGLGSRRASEISGGQRQRVAIARTILSSKRLVLLDEPFTGLDPELKQELRLLLSEIARELKWTTLIASHDDNDATAFGADIIRLKKPQA